MSYLKSITPSIVLFIGLGLATSVSADNASHQQAVQKLFELTGMQQKIEESVDNVLALQFHLEITPSLIEGLLKHAESDLTPGDWVQGKQEIRDGLVNAESNKVFLFKMLQEFSGLSN